MSRSWFDGWLKQKSWRSQRRGRANRFREAVLAVEPLEDRTLLSVVTWIKPSGGNWDQGANWSTGTVPRSTDDAIINTAAAATITIENGDTEGVHSLMTAGTDALSISGGSLTVAGGDSMLAGPLTMTGGSLTASGAGTRFTANGTSIVSSASLYAVGGTLALPMLASFDGSGNKDLFVVASGPGSLLDLSGVTHWQGAGGAYSIQVKAANGANVDLHHLPSLSSGNTWFLAQDPNSRIDLATLTTYVGTRSGHNELRAANGGVITSDNVTSLDTVSLTVSGAASRLPTDQISAFHNANMTVDSGGTLALPMLANFDGSGNNDLFVVATGSKSLLDLSGVTHWQGAGGAYSIQVKAANGANVDLHHLPSLSSGNTWFLAQDPNSRIDLATLTTYVGTRSGHNELRAANGGAIVSKKLKTLNHVTLSFGGTGTIGIDNLESVTNGKISVTNAAPAFSLKLTDVDGSSFFVSHGQLVLPKSVMSYDPTPDAGTPPPGYDDMGEADGGGDSDTSLVCDFINIKKSGQRGALLIFASGGAKISFPCLKTIEADVCFQATGPGSTIELPKLREFDGDNLSHSCIEAGDHAIIILRKEVPGDGPYPVKTTLANVEVKLHAEGQLYFHKLVLAKDIQVRPSVLDGSGTVTGNVVLNGGTINVSQATDSVTVTGQFKQKAGTITGLGLFTVNGLFTWDGGVMSGAGQTNANGGLVLSGGPKALNGRILNNAVAGTWTGGDLSLSNGAVFNNTSSLDIQGDRLNPLNLNINGSTTSFNNPGSLTLEPGLTLMVTGDFSNQGTLTLGPGSTLNVTGNYTQESAATLEVQLGGTDSRQYGQLIVGGTASLAGTLRVARVNGYVPTSGDAFQILTFGSRGGTDFDNYPDGFNLDYDDGTLTITAQ